MPRKDFLRDFEVAAIPGTFTSITDVKAGEYEGSVSFMFKSPGTNLELEFQVILSGWLCYVHFFFKTSY
jgi:ubiquitin-conjugating enzyme E2 Q